MTVPLQPTLLDAAMASTHRLSQERLRGEDVMTTAGFLGGMMMDPASSRTTRTTARSSQEAAQQSRQEERHFARSTQSIVNDAIRTLELGNDDDIISQHSSRPPFLSGDSNQETVSAPPPPPSSSAARTLSNPRGRADVIHIIDSVLDIMNDVGDDDDDMLF